VPRHRPHVLFQVPRHRLLKVPRHRPHVLFKVPRHRPHVLFKVPRHRLLKVPRHLLSAFRQHRRVLSIR
jgi:hypothetical protein